jgi:hypothetical protein
MDADSNLNETKNNPRIQRCSAPQVHFDVIPAALGDDAPQWGAVALALLRLEGNHETRW